MKLRLHGNSIRLRLNRAEVAELIEKGRLQETVTFSEGAPLIYRVELAEEADAPRATFEGNVISIALPRDDAQDWANSDRVGVSARHQWLSILIEKDFQCLHQPDPDAYPNPDAAHH